MTSIRVMLVGVLVAVLWTSAANAQLAAMSIDLGSQFTKVALVKPGVPMEVVLNRESRRKTPTIVGIRNGERAFSDAASSMALKFPKNVYGYLIELLGKKFDHPAVHEYQRRFPHFKLEADENRGTVVFVTDDVPAIKYTVESLVAMIIREARLMTEKYAEQRIADAIVTVPPYFNQAERRALRAAAQLSGVNVLQLINDNVAAGLNYGMFRRKIFNETATTLLLVDMGASKMTATVFEYQVIKDKHTNEKVPTMTTLGTGYDRTLGGFEFTRRVHAKLVDMFKTATKTQTPVDDSPRALAKLLKEAERVKNVLSANVDTIAQVENVMEDKDMRQPFTRTMLDELVGDLYARVAAPVVDALAAAELDVKQIDTVVLMGGGTRMIGVQDALKIALDGADLGKYINGDEAAALGSVYQAAHLTKGFKVARFTVRDTVIHPVQVDFTKEDTHESGDVDDAAADKRMIHRTLFARRNPYPMKKVMTFNKHTHDFEFAVNYGNLKMSETQLLWFGALNITRADVGGVVDAHAKTTTTGDVDADGKTAAGPEWKGIKVHFRMDDSGILHADNAEALLEYPPEVAPEPTIESTFSSLGKKLGSLFASTPEKKVDDGVEESPEDAPQEAGEEEPVSLPKDEKKDEPTKEGEKKSEEKKTEEKKSGGEKYDSKEGKENTTATKNETVVKPKESKPRMEKVALTVQLFNMDMPDIGQDEIDATLKVLAKFDTEEAERRAREAAVNDLEAYVFDTKDKLQQDSFMMLTTDEERAVMTTELDAANVWMEDEATFETPTAEYVDKFAALKKATKDMFWRADQAKDRPRVEEAMKQMLNHSDFLLTTIRKFTDDDQLLSEVEINLLAKKYNETLAWWTEKQTKQATLKGHEEPAYTIVQGAEKIQALEREVKYLVNKMRNAPPKKPKVNATTTANDTAPPTDDKTGEPTIIDTTGEPSAPTDTPPTDDAAEPIRIGDEPIDATTTDEPTEKTTTTEDTAKRPTEEEKPVVSDDSKKKSGGTPSDEL